MTDTSNSDDNSLRPWHNMNDNDNNNNNNGSGYSSKRETGWWSMYHQSNFLFNGWRCALILSVKRQPFFLSFFCVVLCVY